MESPKQLSQDFIDSSNSGRSLVLSSSDVEGELSPYSCQRSASRSREVTDGFITPPGSGSSSTGYPSRTTSRSTSLGLESSGVPNEGGEGHPLSLSRKKSRSVLRHYNPQPVPTLSYSFTGEEDAPKYTKLSDEQFRVAQKAFTTIDGRHGSKGYLNLKQMEELWVALTTSNEFDDFKKVTF
eukprot:TRINITY_DN5233_c0_g1_i1.p1 TRINITY_DN5233_c0_g1~~TRINITY_DN5233_c0_g1_i1.p1  ORF type:complete len:193 (+),score=23.87 TRINITY_DN5233_c0_g1_i1:34-579(+)